jgi:hypothetical protein
LASESESPHKRSCRQLFHAATPPTPAPCESKDSSLNSSTDSVDILVSESESVSPRPIHSETAAAAAAVVTQSVTVPPGPPGPGSSSSPPGPGPTQTECEVKTTESDAKLEKLQERARHLEVAFEDLETTCNCYHQNVDEKCQGYCDNIQVDNVCLRNCLSLPMT